MKKKTIFFYYFRVALIELPLRFRPALGESATKSDSAAPPRETVGAAVEFFTLVSKLHSESGTTSLSTTN